MEFQRKLLAVEEIPQIKLTFSPCRTTEAHLGPIIKNGRIPEFIIANSICYYEF